MEIVRIVEHQADLSSYRATQHEERAVQLELLIEITKPKNLYAEWHPLIATPFRYNPPHPAARFRPPYGKNVFYGSVLEETALYEHAFHFMRQRKHLSITPETGMRTLFVVNAQAEKIVQIRHESNYAAIADKNDYVSSHEFIKKNPHATFLLYPSCRDPQHRDNAAVLDIQHLAKNPDWEASIRFFYDNRLTRLTWIDYQLHINWMDVA